MTEDRASALLAMIDPFVALADGRRQLLDAVERAGNVHDLAEILGIVAAHDQALADVALAFASGARDFSSIAGPGSRDAGPGDIATIEATRASLFDAVDAVASAVEDWLDEVIETPWGGSDTWRMHLVSLAMHDGARAFEIAEAQSRA